MAIPPSQNNQNYDIDIKEMFQNFISGGTNADGTSNTGSIGIDDLRGNINVQALGSSTKDLITLLNINPDAKTSSPVSGTVPMPGTFAQESRCHAFYRLIGFPVVSSDKSSFYSPGYDSIKKDGRTIDLAKKISIASNMDSKFEAISQARETWVSNISNIFSIPTSVEAGVLSLTSGSIGLGGQPIIRQFNAPFIKNATPDAFDFTITDQQYYISSLYGLVGGKAISFSE